MNFFQYLKPERIPSASRRKNVLDIRREIILQIVLNTLLGIYTIGFALIMIFYPQVIRSGKPELYLLPYAGLLIVTLVRTLNFYIRSFFVILALQGLGMMALISYGLSGTGIFFLFGACFLANVLYNSKLSTGVAYPFSDYHRRHWRLDDQRPGSAAANHPHPKLGQHQPVDYGRIGVRVYNGIEHGVCFQRPGWDEQHSPVPGKFDGPISGRTILPRTAGSRTLNRS